MIYSYVPESVAGQAAYGARTAPIELPPPPLVTSRDPIPRVTPGPVASLAARASVTGWDTLVQYSRGYATKWRGAWQEEELFAVRMRKGDHGAFAVYRSIAGRESWTWRDVWMWGADLLPFGQGGVTDLHEWLKQDGRMPDDFYGRITALRVTQAEARSKVGTRRVVKEGLN